MCSEVLYVNSALSIICFTCSIYECDNSFLACVCIWAKCHFVSGEPTYDGFHARDGEA